MRQKTGISTVKAEVVKKAAGSNQRSAVEKKLKKISEQLRDAKAQSDGVFSNSVMNLIYPQI